jgi:hypothetical protein
VVNEFNSNEIVRDSGLGKQINEYAPNIQDQVRRASYAETCLIIYLPFKKKKNSLTT